MNRLSKYLAVPAVALGTTLAISAGMAGQAAADTRVEDTPTRLAHSAHHAQGQAPGRNMPAGPQAQGGMMGQGMMGQGQMGPGMMGQGQMGPGMMGQGQMGPGMMGQGGMGPGMMQNMPTMMQMQHLSVDDVRHYFEHRLERRGNARLKVGEVKVADDDSITVDVVTVDDSLVQRYSVDRHTGWATPAEQ